MKNIKVTTTLNSIAINTTSKKAIPYKSLKESDGTIITLFSKFEELAYKQFKSELN